jgi:hypothetical protein
MRRLPDGQVVSYRGDAASAAAASAPTARPCPSCSGVLSAPARIRGTEHGQLALCGLCGATWRWTGTGWIVAHEQQIEEGM